jgi:hypothetical protein
VSLEGGGFSGTDGSALRTSIWRICLRCIAAMTTATIADTHIPSKITAIVGVMRRIYHMQAHPKNVRCPTVPSTNKLF